MCGGMEDTVMGVQRKEATRERDGQGRLLGGSGTSAKASGRGEGQIGRKQRGKVLAEVRWL